MPLPEYNVLDAATFKGNCDFSSSPESSYRTAVESYMIIMQWDFMIHQILHPFRRVATRLKTLGARNGFAMGVRLTALTLRCDIEDFLSEDMSSTLPFCAICTNEGSTAGALYVVPKR